MAFANTEEKQELITVNGNVKRIISRMPTGWQAVSLKTYKSELPNFVKESARYDADEYTAVGQFKHDIEVGQIVKLTGKWVKHKTYGWQFSVEDSDLLAPETKDEIEAYLCSGMYKGIGPKTAKIIIDTFGDKALEIVEKHPEALAKIKGIKKKKIVSITTSQKANGHLKEIKLFLGNNEGITWNRIAKIYEKYGDDAVKILSQNPYVLCNEIKGFAFLTADKIALAAGVSFDSPYRIKAAVKYILDYTASNKGNLFITQRSLLTQLTKLLSSAEYKIDSASTKPVIMEMIEKGDLIDEDGCYFLKYFYDKEISCAEKIYELCSIPKDCDEHLKEDNTKKLEKIEAKNRIRYSEKQKEAILKAIDNNVSIITGGPGTGKTTIIKAIIALLEECGIDSIALCAPTGRAAKRMEKATGHSASTIHRLLEAVKGGGFRRNKVNPLLKECIIVDEMSMVDIYIFHALIDAINNGTKVVFVGDSDQLPSVGPGNVLKDLIKSGCIPTTLLNEIFRQQNTSRIIINAHKINNGNFYLDIGPDFEFIHEDNPSNVASLLMDTMAKEGQKVGLDNIQILSPLRKKTSAGVNILNEKIQNTLNPYSKDKKEIRINGHIFREGDRVMQTKNDYDREIYNGTVGKISTIRMEDDEYHLVMETEDALIEYNQEEIEQLDLAYATTVHKAQGSEYSIVIIPVLREFYPFFTRDILYTAITRAKSKVILIGQTQALIMAVKNNSSQQRNTMLANRIQTVFEGA